MERLRKMRVKRKLEVKHIISNKIMNIVKKLENKNQNKSSSMDIEGKNKEILMHEDGFFNLINNQNISKIKKKTKKNCIF